MLSFYSCLASLLPAAVLQPTPLCGSGHDAAHATIQLSFCDVYTRRNALSLAAASLLAPLSAKASTAETIFGVGSSERCENGEGSACADLAEGNELVLKLQAQSKANKEKNAKAVVDQTVMQLGYSDYFTAVDKYLVKLPDGKFKAFDAYEYGELRKAGRIKPGAVDVLLEAPAEADTS